MKKLAMLSVTATVAVLVGLWWGYVRAPGPADVCDHIIEVTMAQSEADGMSRDAQAAVVGTIQEQCVQHKLDKIQLRGRIKYAEYAKCVMAADTLAAIEKC